MLGDRVCWNNSAADVGTIIATAWSDVTILVTMVRRFRLAQGHDAVEGVATKVK